MKVHKLKDEDNIHWSKKEYYLCGSNSVGDTMSCRDNEVTCAACLKKLQPPKKQNHPKKKGTR